MANVIIPPAIPTVSVGGRVFTDVKNLIILFANWQGTSLRSTLRNLGGSSGYTPSGSKTFRVLAARFVLGDSITLANGTVCAIGYTDNDAGMAGTTAFTNFVGMAGGAAGNLLASCVGVKGTMPEVVYDFTVPNGKYLSVQGQGGASDNGAVYLFGYEV